MRWAQRGLSDAFWSMTSSYNWLIIDTVTFLLLAIYLDQVLPFCSPQIAIFLRLFR